MESLLARRAIADMKARTIGSATDVLVREVVRADGFVAPVAERGRAILPRAMVALVVRTTFANFSSMESFAMPSQTATCTLHSIFTLTSSHPQPDRPQGPSPPRMPL